MTVSIACTGASLAALAAAAAGFADASAFAGAASGAGAGADCAFAHTDIDPLASDSINDRSGLRIGKGAPWLSAV